MYQDNLYLSLAPTDETIEQRATYKLLACNWASAAYGLVLTRQQAAALAHAQTNALKNAKRIEFESGVIDKLTRAFCDSPYVSTENYEAALRELVWLFYKFKNDTWDAVSDDELIGYMKTAFNGRCHGSLELLSSEALPQLSRHIRSGRSFGTIQKESEGQHGCT